MGYIVPLIYHNSRNHLFDAAFLFLMVVEVICKVWCIDDPETITYPTEDHVKRFMEEVKDEKSEMPKADVVAKIRNVHHDGSEMKMYNRLQRQVISTEVHSRTEDDFISLSKRMCTLFLNWSRISQYLPKEDVEPAVEEELRSDKCA